MIIVMFEIRGFSFNRKEMELFYRHCNTGLNNVIQGETDILINITRRSSWES